MKEMKTAQSFNEVFQREVFGRAEAAIFTTLSVESIDKAVERGDLTSHAEGARVLFLREDLIDYVRRLPFRKTRNNVA